MKCTLLVGVLVPFFAVLSHTLANNNPDEYNDTPIRDSEEVLVPGKTILRERLEDVNAPRIKYLAKLAVDKIDHYGLSVPDPLPRVVTKVFHAVTRWVLDTVYFLTLEVCEQKRKPPEYREQILYKCRVCQIQLFQQRDVEYYEVLFHSCGKKTPWYYERESEREK